MSDPLTANLPLPEFEEFDFEAISESWKVYLKRKAWLLLGSPLTLELGPFKKFGGGMCEAGDIVVFRCVFFMFFLLNNHMFLFLFCM